MLLSYDFFAFKNVPKCPYRKLAALVNYTSQEGDLIALLSFVATANTVKE